MKYTYTLLIFTFLSLLLLPNISYGQSFSLNDDFMSSLKSGRLNPSEVKELIISPINSEEKIKFLFSKTKENLQILSQLKDLKKLLFNKLYISSSVDTIITFDPENFEEIVRVESNVVEYSPYSILHLFDYFSSLEELSLNFIDNEKPLNLFMTDFNWFRITEKIEGEMNIALHECCKENDIVPPYSSSPDIKNIYWMWDWDGIYPSFEEFSSLYRPQCNPWVDDRILTDEEYCKEQPDFCDEFGKPFFNRNFTSEIDTAFLIEIGEWPIIDNTEEEQQLSSLSDCRDKVLENVNWSNYGQKCAELIQISRMSQEELFESLFSKLSLPSQELVNKYIDPNLSEKEQELLRNSLVKKLYYYEVWQSISPWGAKTRQELLISQLSKLKQLRHLTISNNFTLNIEELINMIAQELPNLEVLEIYNCETSNLPTNINLLSYLNLVIINDQCINTNRVFKENDFSK